MQTQAKECLQPLEALRPFREGTSLPTPQCTTMASRVMREWNSVGLNLPLCDNLLHQPQETNMCKDMPQCREYVTIRNRQDTKLCIKFNIIFVEGATSTYTKHAQGKTKQNNRMYKPKYQQQLSMESELEVLLQFSIISFICPPHTGFVLLFLVD